MGEKGNAGESTTTGSGGAAIADSPDQGGGAPQPREQECRKCGNIWTGDPTPPSRCPRCGSGDTVIRAEPGSPSTWTDPNIAE